MRPRNIPLSISITLVFTFLYIISITFIISFSYYRNSKSLLEVSEELIRKTSEKVFQSAKDHLAPVMTYSKELAFCLNEGILKASDLLEFSADRVTDTEQYFLNILNFYPQIRLIYYATENGYFFCAEKLDSGLTEIILIDPTKPDYHALKKHLDSEFNVVAAAENPDQYRGYNPLLRGWYREAKAQEGLALTDMYVFVSGNNTIGLTASTPFNNPSDSFSGVAACDIVLSDISRYLEKLEIGRSGKAVIIDDNRKVVACPGELSSILITTPEGPRIRDIDELGIDWLKKADLEYRRTQRTSFIVKSDGINYVISVKPFFQQLGKDWKIVICVPENEFIGEMKNNNKLILIFTFAIFLISIFLIYYISINISKPLVVLADEAMQIRELEEGVHQPVVSRILEIDDLAEAVSKLKKGTLAFKKFVPEDLVKDLIKSGRKAELTGESRYLTVLFTKIVGFGEIVEGLPPEYLMLHLAEYLDEVSGIIVENHGTIDKYVGDIVMAFWGAPRENTSQEMDCCRSAVMIKRRLRTLNIKWKKEHKAKLETRIGIHSGKSIVGNFGSAERMNFTLLGDDVNLSSRLKDINDLYGTEIIVSEATHSPISGSFISRPLGYVRVKGKEKEVMIYELLDMKDDDCDSVDAELALRYSEAYQEYSKKSWTKALALIEAFEKDFPDDIPMQKLKSKCLKYMQTQIDDDWLAIDMQFREEKH